MRFTPIQKLSLFCAALTQLSATAPAQSAHHDVLIKQCVQPMEVGRRIVESPRAPLLREPAFVTSAVAL